MIKKYHRKLVVQEYLHYQQTFDKKIVSWNFFNWTNKNVINYSFLENHFFSLFTFGKLVLQKTIVSKYKIWLRKITKTSVFVYISIIIIIYASANNCFLGYSKYDYSKVPLISGRHIDCFVDRIPAIGSAIAKFTALCQGRLTSG